MTTKKRLVRVTGISTPLPEPSPVLRATATFEVDLIALTRALGESLKKSVTGMSPEEAAARTDEVVNIIGRSAVLMGIPPELVQTTLTTAVAKAVQEADKNRCPARRDENGQPGAQCMRQKHKGNVHHFEGAPANVIPMKGRARSHARKSTDPKPL
jgi:hypothetical protein